MSNASLIALIDQMVIDKTIGLDAIDRVKELKDSAAAQVQRISVLEKSNASYQSDATLRQSRISTLEARIAAHEKREADLVERERKIFDHEKAAAVAIAQTAAYREVAGMVFKNTTIKEHVLSNQAQWVSGHNGGGPLLMNAPESKTYERTAE